MMYIAFAAVAGVLLLHSSGAIPLDSVGGAIVITVAFFAAALAVGIHEAWTQKRGAVGWIVNIVASLVGAFVGAQFGGMIVVIVLSLFGNVESSIAKAGGPAMSFALAGGVLAAIVGSWGALQIVNRLR